ncbi:flagellar biosynthesis protein FlhB [Sulfitobacter sp. S190]|uniref:EscU/YscU/HrcU family type III secretion system export apparatus switch protein n=1 Tax=Sulfitobacter sp. S190 TaxID=2867022 RepID=UPI0021A4F6A2|nr:flagellar type III secretion system protein FlhB [Sulfitobacter sp. S190]UWR22366.1 flagellar type III secretion system protein FlhB [Sulfitobacter sp. S190]
MSGQDDDSEKSFEATAHKLQEARKKGEIALSNDLLSAAAYLGLLVALVAAGSFSVDRVTSTMIVLLDQSSRLSELFFAGGAAAPVGGLLQRIGGGLLPVFALPAIGVILALIAQKAPVFAPTKLAPKLSRISIISNAKNKFGRSGLFEFFKSFVKLCIFSTSLTIFLKVWMPDMISALQTGPQIVIGLLAKLFIGFLLVVVLVSAAIGSIDAIWQHAEHMRKNRMSRKEITDETKNSEGDPHLKQERRQRALSASQNQMMKDVPSADVIIVNPTHYAVALKWSRAPGEAPVCVAKGVDEIAATIRRVAQDANVPIHSDPPTARALHATIEIGQEIEHGHFAAVAAAIRFAEAMRHKAKGRV